MKCILCHIPMERYLFKNGYWIYRCPSCSLRETELKKEYDVFIKEFYSQGYYEGDPTRSAYANYVRDKSLIVRNMHKFLSYLPTRVKPARLLDVGCAFGYFVELALTKGYDAYGFDPSEFASREAGKLVGPTRIKEGSIRSITYPKKSFDVITLFDVFEHLSDPLDDMKKLAGLLKDDGVLLIATGDTGSLAARLFKRRWTFYIPPQHIFFFDRTTVVDLLQRAGLTVRAWHRVGKWLSLGYVLHLARTTGESKLAHVLYKMISRTWLVRLPLYIPMKDNMVLEVEKIRS